MRFVRVGIALLQLLMVIAELEKMHLCDRRLDNAVQCLGRRSQIKRWDQVAMTFEVFLMVMEETLRGYYLVKHII